MSQPPPENPSIRQNAEGTDLAQFLNAGVAAASLLGKEKLSQLIHALPSFVESQSDEEGDSSNSVKMLADEIGADPELVGSVRGVLVFLALGEILKEDAAEITVSIAKELQLPVEFDRARLIQFIEIALPELRKVSIDVKNADARRVARAGALPSFEEVSFTVEMRGAFHTVNTKNTDVFAGFVPVASIRIDTDIGEPSSYSFQANLYQLEELIRSLEKVRSRLKMIMEKTE